MKKGVILAALAAMVIFQAKVHGAGLDYYLPDHASYDRSVPRPSEVLGFEIDQWQVTPEQAVEYIREVAASSGRVKLVRYGYSHEMRPLHYVIITSEKNHSALDDIKSQHLQLTLPKESAGVDIARLPVFTWIGHSIHGNETSGINASLLLIYHLAAATDSETLGWLDESVVFVDPVLNPDGVSRFSSWVNSHKSRTYNDDPSKREQQEPWPRGRTNHYWFDLNRDWMNLQNPESQSRVEALLEWMPNVYADAHEQGSEAHYHFSPGAPTRVHPLIPDECQHLIGRMAGEFYAPAFDRQGMLYFSGEVYDDYYIGRGREYLDFHGGIAILWEQPSPRGFAQMTSHGPLTFELSIRNQLTAGLSTVRGAYQMRRELLDYQRRYFASALEDAAGDPVKAYVFSSRGDDASAWHFAELIRRNGIDVYHPSRDFTLDGKTYPAGESYIVPLSQTRYRLIHGIFETRQEYRDSIAYDITGWTMPYSFNVTYGTLGKSGYSSSLLGEAFTADSKPEGRFYDRDDAYAYVFGWSGYYAPRALWRLLESGVQVKVSERTFSAEGREFGRGTILVPMGGVYQNIPREEVCRILAEVAREDGIDVFALGSGFTGGHNLGSGNFRPVRVPRLAVVGGEGASPSGVGEIWHLFDTRYNMPVSVLDFDNLARVDFAQYNTIIFSGAPRLSENDAVRLREWVAAGNVLIGYEGALKLFASAGLADYKFADRGRNDFEVAYEDFNVAYRSRGIAGVIFDTEIDPSHPLFWGYDQKNLPLFKNNSVILEWPSNRYRVAASYTDDPLLSGNVLKSVAGTVAGAPAVVVDRLGKGRVIGIADNPNFRAVWYGTNKLTANAVFWGGLINPLALD